VGHCVPFDKFFEVIVMKARTIKCPRCQKPTVYSLENEYRPFCSSLCKLQDTGAWAYEEYKIAGPPADPEDIMAQLGNDGEQGDEH
jgi:endogenous inhibitor of DNA gyrase (YacG/DUF329 family)